MDHHPAVEQAHGGDFTGFQGPTDMLSFSEPQQRPSAVDFENAFSFGSTSAPVSAPAPTSKASILGLYSQQPGLMVAPMGQGLPQQNSSAPTNGPKPNYNVVLDPVYPNGMSQRAPVAPALPLHSSPGVLRYQNPAMAQLQPQGGYSQVPQGYPQQMPVYQGQVPQQPGYYNPNMRPPPSYVAPSYVNPNHLSALNKGTMGNTF